MAPTLYQIEGQYRDRVNFVMVNGDRSENWPLIEALGVDAIPHLALLEADGTVDTALIGPVPREWLVQDLEVLLENAAAAKGRGALPGGGGQRGEARRALPFQMLDVFANRPPEQRRIHIGVTTPNGEIVDEGP
jgi:thioredoxin-like negative regulator of GroEL